MHKNFKIKYCFFVILPPPNITGEIHIGHFYQYFIIDVIIKWKLLQGYKIYFLFGIDHAGISCIIKFKKKKNIYIYKKKFKYVYIRQLFYINFIIKKKKIEFTLSKNFKKILKKIFFFFLNKNIIYIKKNLINLNLKKKILSDFELKKKKFLKFCYFIKYKFKKKNIIVNTFNIESFLFEKNIFYNYNDIRYKEFFFLISPFKKKIFLKKKKVNEKFGSGLIKSIKNYNKKIEFCSFLNEKNKICFKNFYINNNYLLIKKKILNYKVNNKNIKLKIFNYLKKNNYIICIKKKNHKIIVDENFSKIYYLIIDQWFLKIKKIFSIKKIFFKITLLNKYKKLIFDWIKNIVDWCISRQINWGLKIPFYKDKENCIFYKKNNRFLKLKNNKEVFDTWYNSSIWIIYIYIKFNKKQNLLISGYDIVFFWIIKMLIFNILIFKKILLKKIILHGLIKDKFNKKISKSTNNLLNFNNIKYNINYFKKKLLKNNLNDIIIETKLENKKYFKLKKKSKINNLNLIKKYFCFKIKIIKHFENNFYFFQKYTVNKNLFSKKIFIKINQLYFPLKNKIYIKNWNFIINFFFNFIVLKNIFFIFKIFNKIYFFKNIYFVIFFKIKIIFYVKYKN